MRIFFLCFIFSVFLSSLFLLFYFFLSSFFPLFFCMTFRFFTFFLFTLFFFFSAKRKKKRKASRAADFCPYSEGGEVAKTQEPKGVSLFPYLNRSGLTFCSFHEDVKKKEAKKEKLKKMKSKGRNRTS